LVSTISNWALDADDDEDDEDDEEVPEPKDELPVVPVPELELLVVPLEDDELPAVTCCPTVRFTADTVPAMVEVSVASANELWAEESWACDEATKASSAAIWALEALSAWSVASLDWSEASVA